jgi:hypothetical protein
LITFQSGTLLVQKGSRGKIILQPRGQNMLPENAKVIVPNLMLGIKPRPPSVSVCRIHAKDQVPLAGWIGKLLSISAIRGCCKNDHVGSPGEV